MARRRIKADIGWAAVRALRLEHTRHPVDEYPQLGADMAVRRESQVHRHRFHLPVVEQAHQFTAGQVWRGHVMRQPEHAQARQAGSQIGVAIVDRQPRAAVGLDALFTPLHRIGQGLAGARPEKTHRMMTSRLQFARMHRRAGAL